MDAGRISRRTAAKAVGATGLGLFGITQVAGEAAAEEAASPPPASRPTPTRPTPQWGPRAVATHAAIRRYMAVNDGSHLYRERYPHRADDNAYSYEWPFSQMHAATLDLTGMVSAGRRFTQALAEDELGQSRYWSDAGSTGLPGHASYPMPPWGGGGDFFYDDNEWVGLLDVQRHLMHGGSLDEARAIFDLVVSGWDTDPSHPSAGGVFWTQAPWSQDRNTVSNMPGAQLGLRLHLLTGEQYFLDWSMKMYEWTKATLQRDDGLYHDNIKLSGDIDRTIWSYNQGVPVGVNTLLHLVTGERRYLDEARRIADAASSYYAGGQLEKQPPFFVSIYFKNLLLLASVTGDGSAHRRMHEYATWAWTTYRDSDTGLFTFPNDDPERAELIENAAMVQIMAVLAWPEKRWGQLY